MSVVRCVGDDRLEFKCPGCGWTHDIHLKRSQGPTWTWNGDLDQPTISPSVRIQWRWGTLREYRCCHFFVRDGRIEFCTDCTHELAGQVVPMTELTP